MLSDSLEKMLEKPDSLFLKTKVAWGLLTGAKSSPHVKVPFQDCVGGLLGSELSPVHPETLFLAQCFQ